MTLDLVERAKNTVSVRLNELRASNEDLTAVRIPELSDSSDSDSDVEDSTRRSFSNGKPVIAEEKADVTVTQPALDNEVEELMKKARKSTYDEGIRAGKRRRRLEKAKTKGKGWFDLPATEITKEIEMDLQLIRMRKSLNPKQFFKNSDTGAAMPKYFQIGTVKSSAVEFYSNRIPKKKQKKTIIDGLLEDDGFRKFYKRKYDAVKHTAPKKKQKQRKK